MEMQVECFVTVLNRKDIISAYQWKTSLFLTIQWLQVAIRVRFKAFGGDGKHVGDLDFTLPENADATCIQL